MIQIQEFIILVFIVTIILLCICILLLLNKKGNHSQRLRISRLLITDEFDIILLDYNNLEIRLTPLPKAVYILFLRHPEGIKFKTLPSYKNELLEIYKYVTNKDSLPELVESIKSVTDPLSNSINEKCSRIREAFVSELNGDIAQHYYITGLRGEDKKIVLNRRTVQLPQIIERIPRTNI